MAAGEKRRKKEDDFAREAFAKIEKEEKEAIDKREAEEKAATLKEALVKKG